MESITNHELLTSAKEVLAHLEKAIKLAEDVVNDPMLVNDKRRENCSDIVVSLKKLEKVVKNEIKLYLNVNLN